LTIAKVALGLGFVIFIHELGHFLLAKWNGVKVEKFSIGFGPTLFGWRRGETEYVLAALPLGGFVKMLGEGPDEQASQSTDPRAYPNKSVSARMAIISAGVIMNLLLAAACFVFFYQHERHDSPAVLGEVIAGSPAYEAGLMVGDEIAAIDDRRDLGFTDLLQKVLLSVRGKKTWLASRSSRAAKRPATGRQSASGRATASRSATILSYPGWRMRRHIRGSTARTANRRSTSWSRPGPPAKPRHR
jgi:RIP metalloprotease RseP